MDAIKNPGSKYPGFWDDINLYVILHGISQIAVGLQLIAGNETSGCGEQTGNPVYDGGAGVLHSGRFHHMEFGIRLAGDPPVALVAVIRPVDLADGFLLDGDSLHGFNGYHRRHADAVACGDGLS